jgi:DNA-directed RNA polymerase subunit RPC12/RpoP
MSEFKYACPVCGQHIKCDSSQAGTVMDCPTCFQKITVPQAPADQDQKFILTGSKVSEKVITVRGVDAPAAVAPVSQFPGAAVVLLILVFVCAAVGIVYWATIIHPRQSASGAQATNSATAGNKPKPAEKPAPVAPPANDTNWMLVLNTNPVPDSPVVGRIHGRDFIAERAQFQNGSLTIRAGTRGGVEFGALINFGGATPEELSDKAINVTTNAEKAAKISLRWKDEAGTVQKPGFDSGYAMRLKFGPLANNRLPGRIYICLPDDEKSYLMGSFNANVSKPKPKTEQKPPGLPAPK